MIRKRGQFYSYEFMQDRQRFYGVFNGADASAVPRSKQEAREREAEIRRGTRAGTFKHASDRESFASFFDNNFHDLLEGAQTKRAPRPISRRGFETAFWR